MIKTKYLVTSQNFFDPEEIDDLINDFLKKIQVLKLLILSISQIFLLLLIVV